MDILNLYFRNLNTSIRHPFQMITDLTVPNSSGRHQSSEFFRNITKMNPKISNNVLRLKESWQIFEDYKKNLSKIGVIEETLSKPVSNLLYNISDTRHDFSGW